MTHLRIRTPEGVEFSQPLAGPLSRAIAYLIDLAAMVVALSATATLFSILSLISPDVSQALISLGFFLLPILYGVCCEWLWRGQTIGKRLLHLRVVDAEGLRLRPSQIVLRNLLRAVDFLPLFYLVGGAACLLSPRGQRLGDIAARTVVVRIPQVPSPDLEPVLGTRFNSLRSHPHLAARLRQSIHPEEAALALQALARRENFEPDARVQLFASIAEHVRNLVAFPPETDESLTDEQFVRNVVDILYRPRGTDDGARPRAS